MLTTEEVLCRRASCGKTFTKYRTPGPGRRDPRAVYCSFNCASWDRRGSRLEKNKTRECIICERVFLAPVNTRVYCYVCVPTDAARARWYKYHITEPEYQALLAKHAGMCWICVAKPATCIDHDHACCPVKSKSCGRCVRGMLCAACNHRLLNDHDEWYRRSEVYLQVYRESR